MSCSFSSPCLTARTDEASSGGLRNSGTFGVLLLLGSFPAGRSGSIESHDWSENAAFRRN